MPPKPSATTIPPSPAMGHPHFIPSEIQVLGHTVRIQLVSKRKIGDAVGDWDTEKFLIRLLKTQSPEAMISTLNHELLHAVLYFSGWADQLKDMEEGLVLALEHLYVPLLRSLKWPP